MRKMTGQATCWSAALAAAIFVMLAGFGDQQYAAATEVGVEEGEIASLEEGPAVRRQFLFRSGRFEITPQATFSINDPFVRNALPGVGFSYYLNNVLGIVGSAHVGVLQLDTSLRQNLESSMATPELQQTSYSRVGWAADVGLAYVPMFGKFTLMNAMAMHYDVHLIGGMAMIGESAVPAAEGGDLDPELEGVRPGGMLGAGMRFFLTDMVSLNFQVRNYIAARSQAISQGEADLRLGNTVMLTTGVGIFFPGDVQISR